MADRVQSLRTEHRLPGSRLEVEVEHFRCIAHSMFVSRRGLQQLHVDMPIGSRRRIVFEAMQVVCKHLHRFCQGESIRPPARGSQFQLIGDSLC